MIDFQQLMTAAGFVGQVTQPMKDVAAAWYARHPNSTPSIQITHDSNYPSTESGQMRDAYYIHSDQFGGHWYLQTELVTDWNVMTREQARQLKATRYWNGEPCSKGHVSQRYTSSGACCKCIKIANSKHRGGDTVLYKVRVHPDDVEMMDATAKALKKARLQKQLQELE